MKLDTQHTELTTNSGEPHEQRSRDDLAQLRQLGHEHLQAKRWVSADELFMNVLAYNAEDEDALLGIAIASDALGRYENLEEVSTTLLKLHPGSAPGLAYKARALQKLERISEATIANDQALLLDTHLPLAWINRSGLQLLQQKFPDALRSTQRAVDLAPNDVRAWANRGMALFHCQYPAEALAAFTKALECDPDHLLSLQMKGELLTMIGRMTEALATAQHALALQPTDVIALTQAIKALRALEMHDELSQLALQLTQLTPDSIFAWENYLRSLRGAGHFEEAIGIVDRVLELDPNNVRFWTMKADTLYRLHRYREAANIADQALLVNREYPPANRIRERALTLMYQRKEKKK